MDVGIPEGRRLILAVTVSLAVPVSEGIILSGFVSSFFFLPEQEEEEEEEEEKEEKEIYLIRVHTWKRKRTMKRKM